jgi:hypothetical protein
MSGCLVLVTLQSLWAYLPPDTGPKATSKRPPITGFAWKSHSISTGTDRLEPVASAHQGHGRDSWRLLTRPGSSDWWRPKQFKALPARFRCVTLPEPRPEPREIQPQSHSKPGSAAANQGFSAQRPERREKRLPERLCAGRAPTQTLTTGSIYILPG